MPESPRAFSLFAVILTYNEERHLERCIKSLGDLCEKIIVVDSFSTDSTVDIARSLGAEVYQNPYVNQAVQFNWALDEVIQGTGQWILRIDADEVLSPELQNEIRQQLASLKDSVSGVFINRRIAFLNRPIRYGGLFPISVLRIFRSGKGRSEVRWMDEHIQVSGETVQLNGEILDDNLQPLTWWTQKHNSYSSREVVDTLNRKYRFMHLDSIASLKSGGQASRKRWIKENIYARMPLGVRSVLYFFYRYILRLGFLDGTEGFAFHFLQGLWYRCLVDLKLREVEKYIERHQCPPQEAIKAVLGIDV